MLREQYVMSDQSSDRPIYMAKSLLGWKAMLPFRFGTSSLFLLLLLWCPLLTCYESPEDFEDVFGRRPCPAFLTFSNAAYVTGTTVELPCHCKPREALEVVWFYKKHGDSWEETRALTDHHGTSVHDSSGLLHSSDLRSRFSIRLFSLLIFNAGPQDSGLYVCGSAHNDFYFAYDVDIQEVRAMKFITSISNVRRSASTGKRSSNAPLYRVFTSYQAWSVCDRCDVKGEQVRVGLCYVYSEYLLVRYRRANQTASSCGSGAVPSAFGLSEHGASGASMQIRQCHVPCPPQAPSSQTLLNLTRFLGYASSSHNEVLPVFHLKHPAGQNLVLGCPGSRPNMVVAWDRESNSQSKPIYRFEHSVGRVIIDTGHLLIFTPATAEDSGTYYCWLQGRRAAEIRLSVYSHSGKGLGVTSHPDFQSSLRLVLISYITMTIVFSVLVLGRLVFGNLSREHQTLGRQQVSRVKSVLLSCQTFLNKVGRQQVSRVKSVLSRGYSPNQTAASGPHADRKQPG